MSEEALQIAEKRREAKGKGENERHTHPNAEFQKIKSLTVSIVSPSICPEVMGPDAMILVF